MQDVLVSRWPIPGPDSRSSSVPLPTELVLEITELLREQDIRRVAQVSKRFRLINGPLIYRNQHASNIGELMKLKAVAEQHDAAAMIKSLTLDTMTMNYWWHGTSQIIASLLPRMENLETLSLSLSHSPSNRLCQSISQLSCLTALRIQLKNATLGPHIGLIGGLREISLELAPPSWASTDKIVGELTSMLEQSRNTLEKLSLWTHNASCTISIIESLAGSTALQTVLASCHHLSTVSLHLEVKDETSAIEAVKAVAFLPVVDFKLKCNPSIYPLPPSAGYGLGISVLEQISDLLPKIQTLQLEDGEIGKRNLQRAPDGTVFEQHINCLRALEHLQSADVPILLDDILVYVPTDPKDDDLPKTNGTNTPQENADVPSAPRVEFEKNVNNIISRAVRGLLVTSKGDGRSSIFQTTQGGIDEEQYQLPRLTSLKFKIRPTPFLARNMRAARVYLPVMEWSKQIIRDDTNHVIAWQPTLAGDIDISS
ncbi:hypothetical protein FRC03_003985 [Tulasnella sp. 419]|nr:hypothetical protein FRC03_003985 [Tulasnella sp. 419]